MHGAKFSTGSDAVTFLLAGRARVTLVSEKTGARFTFKITKKDTVHFVKVLTGQNNDSDYEFMGTIFEGKKFVHGRRARIGQDAPSAKAFAWAWNYLAKGELPPSCEVWHEGSCGRCGRALTVPSSISNGLGPECASKMG